MLIHILNSYRITTYRYIVCVQHGKLEIYHWVDFNQTQHAKLSGRFLLFRIFIQIPRRREKMFLHCGQALFLLVMLECDKKKEFSFLFQRK